MSRYVLALAVLFSLAVDSRAAQIISTIATSNAQGGVGLSVPSINDNGTVAYVDSRTGTLYTSAGGVTSTVVTNNGLLATPTGLSGGFYGSATAPQINDRGDVAYWSSVFFLPSVTLHTQAGDQVVAANPPPIGPYQGVAYSSSPGVSNSGHVVLSVSRSFSIFAGQGAGVYEYAGGALTPLRTDPAFGTTLPDPAISRSGVIAYAWPYYNGTLFAGNTLTVVANGVASPRQNLADASLTSLAVNNSGTILASTGGVASANGGLELIDASGIVQLASVGTNFWQFGSAAINDSGAIAFSAVLPNTQWGIFRGTDPVRDQVIKYGDPLGGSTVTGLGFGTGGLNDNGQIVFWASLADGRQGIFEVSAVPEPTSMALAAAGAVALAAIAIRRWQKLTSKLVSGSGTGRSRGARPAVHLKLGNTVR